MRSVPKIHPETISRISTNWLHAIQTNENVISVFPIHSAGYHRIYSLIEDAKLCKSVLKDLSKYSFNVYKTNENLQGIKDILSELFEINKEFNTPIELVTEINSKFAKQKKHVFFIYFIDSWFNQDELLFYLSRVSDLCENIQFIFLTQKNLHKKETLSKIGKYHQLFQQIQYIPLYSKKDFLYYIQNIGEFLNHPITDTQAQQIYDISGRHIYLVKQATRVFCNNVPISEIQFDISYKLKASQLWNLFTKNEQELIRQILLNKKVDSEKLHEEFDHLKALEIIKKENNQFFVTIKGLKKFAQLEITKKLSFYSENIYLDNQIIDKKFTKNEFKLLSFILSNKKRLITKDEIASLLSTNDVPISDWAIDKIINRLRAKLEKVGFKEKLTTIRGRGYIWED